MAEAYLAIVLTSALFSAGRWAARKISSKQAGKGRPRVDEDTKPSAGETKVDIDVDVGLEEYDSMEGAIVAVGLELAKKASRKVFGSRTLRDRAITGLSTEFAVHRNQTQRDLSELAASQQLACHAVAEEFSGVRGDLRDLSEIAASQQVASQAVADALVGVRQDFRYGADQLTRGLAAMRTDLGAIAEGVEGMRNDVVGGFQEVSWRLSDVSTGLRALGETMTRREQQQELSTLQNLLSEAGIYLDKFSREGGDDFGLLDKANKRCIKMLSMKPHPDTLDARQMAGAIMVATSYTKNAQLKSPATAKKYVFDSDFRIIAKSLKPLWADQAAAHTLTWNTVVRYLLDIASSICLFPPEGLFLGELDSGLAEAFGVLCSSQPSLLDRFPEVGGAALRALLQAKSLDELRRAANFLEVDISSCRNQADFIQALLDTGKPLDAALNQVFRIDQSKAHSHGTFDEEELATSVAAAYEHESPLGINARADSNGCNANKSDEDKRAASAGLAYEKQSYATLDARTGYFDTSDQEDNLAASAAPAYKNESFSSLFTREESSGSTFDKSEEGKLAASAASRYKNESLPRCNPRVKRQGDDHEHGTLYDGGRGPPAW